MLTLEGTLNTIQPGFELASEAEQLVGLDQQQELGGAEGMLRKELMRALPALRTLPEHAEALATQLRSGRLVPRTERYAGSDRAVVEDWLNRGLVATAAAAGALTSGVILVAGSLSTVTGVRDALWTLGFSGLTGSSVLLMRTVAQALHGRIATRE